VIPDPPPVSTPHSPDWLDDLLLDTVSPLADDGFSAGVMRRIGELTVPYATSAPAACVSPAEALSTLSAGRGHRRARWRAGLTGGAGMVTGAALTLGAPLATGDVISLLQQALLLASVPLLTGWLLARGNGDSAYL
jgi:hypothetical protein